MVDVSTVTAYLLDFIHFFLIFFPFSIYFIEYPRFLVKIMFLFSSMVALSWIFFKNRCVITLMSSNLRGEKKVKKNFSQVYLSPFYNVIMKIFMLEDTKLGFNQAINIHWMLNIFLLWYYLFYYKCKC